MAYNGKPFFKIPRPVLLAGGVEVSTLAGNITLTDKSSLFQILDADGVTRNVTLPPEKHGRVYIIKNAGAAGDLAVKDDAAGGVITLSPNESVVLTCDDTIWYVVINVNNL